MVGRRSGYPLAVYYLLHLCNHIIRGTDRRSLLGIECWWVVGVASILQYFNNSYELTVMVTQRGWQNRSLKLKSTTSLYKSYSMLLSLWDGLGLGLKSRLSIYKWRLCWEEDLVHDLNNTRIITMALRFTQQFKARNNCDENLSWSGTRTRDCSLRKANKSFIDSRANRSSSKKGWIILWWCRKAV